MTLHVAKISTLTVKMRICLKKTLTRPRCTVNGQIDVHDLVAHPSYNTERVSPEDQ